MVPGVIGYIPEYRGVTGTTRRLLGLMGPIGGRGEAAKGQPCAPPPQVRIGQGGGGAPHFLSPYLSFPLLSYSNMEGGSPTPLLPVGVGLLMGRAKGGQPPPPPPLLYIWGGRHPLETQQLIP